MLNNKYNKNTLEAVTQGSEVGGCPSKFLSLLKTTLLLLLTNSSFANDFLNKALDEIDGFNKYSPITISCDRNTPETSQEAMIRIEKERAEIDDVKLNKAEVRDGRYWVDGRWVCPSKTYESAKTATELRDSDNDGYDDYTEFKNGTSPNDASIFPAIRDGNNKVVFK